MIFSSNLIALFTCALLVQNVVSHPGHDHAEELARRSHYMNHAARRSLSHCSDSLKARGLDKLSSLRRRELAEHLRQKRAIGAVPYLRARDLDAALGTSHHSSLNGLTADSSDATLFSGNSSCILNPEVTQGPYYVTGEHVRKNVTDGQPGIPLTVDIQIIDINTCNPIPNVMLDFWHCNSTGVYSGVVANGNGNSDDPSNLDATFLRGLQSSDADGVVTFDSVFPGHYSGRTTHIHILGHLNATIAANNTLATTGQIAHVGQLFFDQDLLTQVATVTPYSTNNQSTTLNEDDSILGQAAEDVDPMMEYVLLGNTLSEGVLAWTSIGINASSNYSVSAAATIYETGGVENENGMGGGPGGNGPVGGNGTMPSGAPLSNQTTSSQTTSSQTASGQATSTQAASSAKDGGRTFSLVTLLGIVVGVLGL